MLYSVHLPVSSVATPCGQCDVPAADIPNVNILTQHEPVEIINSLLIRIVIHGVAW